jgi:hypothetical protein
MARILVAFVVTVSISALGRTVSADDATAILKKAMKALGGEDNLKKIEGAIWKSKGKLRLGDHTEHDFTGQTIMQGLDRVRSEAEIEYVGQKHKMLTILNGDRALQVFGRMPLQPDDAVARLKSSLYLTLIPVTLTPLTEQRFKVSAAGAEKVGDRLAVVLKVTCPDGKDFTISFDKESGLPVKAVGTIFTLDGRQVTQETTYSDYKNFEGIKVATRLESKIDGEPSRKSDLTEFKLLDKVDPMAFSIPKEADRQAETIPGPESDKLLPATTGYAIFAFGSDRPGGIAAGDIIAVELPTLKDTVVRPTVAPNQVDMPTIHSLSGPDAEGRVAYIEDHFFVADEKTRRHLLKTIKLDGTNDTELFSRPGDAMWANTGAGHGDIGSDLVLSPVGGRVAFLSGLTHVQMPSAYLSAGTVEIWDVAKKTGTKTGVNSLEGLAWFPDGKRLAYVKLVEPKAAAPAEPPADSFGSSFNRWPKIPAVFVRDVEAQTESFLHIGWNPVVSFDGQSVLVSENGGGWNRVDVVTGKSASATWPGLWAPIALPAQDIVLSLCVPTKGAKVRFTEHNSALVGPKEMLSLKLAKVNGNEFQTVVPHIDPRTHVSFGQVSRKKE